MLKATEKERHRNREEIQEPSTSPPLYGGLSPKNRLRQKIALKVIFYFLGLSLYFEVILVKGSNFAPLSK